MEHTSADADYKLAAGLQEQETSTSAYGGLCDLDSQLKKDEAFARALQDAYDQEQFMIMLSLQEFDDIPTRNRNIRQDDVDPDSMSYEELRGLGEALGAENVGLTSKEINMLPVKKFKGCFFSSNRDENCVICQDGYEKGVSVVTLPCKHLYHADCIKTWLRERKVCPVCNSEVVVGKGHR